MSSRFPYQFLDLPKALQQARGVMASARQAFFSTGRIVQGEGKDVWEIAGEAAQQLTEQLQHAAGKVLAGRQR